MSQFETRVVAGGAPNQLRLLDVAPTAISGLPEVAVTWVACPGANVTKDTAHAKNPVTNSDGTVVSTATMLVVSLPEPPDCEGHKNYIYEQARVTIRSPEQLLFDSRVPVSRREPPLVITLAILALIYPGCAIAAWLVQWSRSGWNKPPNVVKALDPVQITADSYGRASLAKLQIFGFSIIVFGLLVYYQFRNGILSGLSQDVLLLLGISAVGTVGGRITYAAKRRFSLDNWAWLRRNGWFTNTGEDVGRTASWSQLVVDADKGEFDPYSFQMAIFSIVVAIALINASLIGLTSFEIPGELLGLLGLSQVVFIAGKAAEKSGYTELDDRITSIRAHERSFQEMRALASASSGPTEPEAKARAEAHAKADSERAAFKSEVAQAADMFGVLYGPLPTAVAAVVHTIEPEEHLRPASPPVVGQ